MKKLLITIFLLTTFSVLYGQKLEATLLLDGNIVDYANGIVLSDTVGAEHKLQVELSDSNWVLLRWEVTLARDARSILTKRLGKTNEVDLTDFLKQAKPGDRIVFEFERVLMEGYSEMRQWDKIFSIPLDE